MPRILLVLTVVIAMAYSILSCTTLPANSAHEQSPQYAGGKFRNAAPRQAPGFADAVLGRQIMSPLDLERTFGLVGGDIFHGALSLNQLFSARPMLGQANYRGAIPGLYLCGSGTHPGGGVTGAPGHNAAQVIAAEI